MENYKQRAKEILAQLTLEEKIALQTGADNWNTESIPRVDLPSIAVSDGPHGLRKTVDSEGDNLGIAESLPAVCMPTACKLACSFDRELLTEVGKALGRQARAENVSVLLGPGINIKRNSRCGRNFEYFSEDPYLAGELAVAYVNGVQSEGVGVSLKHFAANSQEYARMTSDSCIDKRALNEIYLSAFQKVVQKAHPWTVMCAYNKLNGELCSQNKTLLTDILRNSWGFDGLVMSDWGAVSDRAQSVAAGLDLQMPHGDYAAIKRALKKGTLKQQQLDECVLRIIELVLRSEGLEQCEHDYEAQHQLARRASADSTVLLRNVGNILPLDSTADLAVIGVFAQHPHFQGGGSSKVNAYKQDSLLGALDSMGIEYEYSEGYDLNSAEACEDKLREATNVAQRHKTVLLVVGLPDVCEYEGFDRDNMALPESHRQLIERVTAVNSNVIAVLQCGSPVETDWAQSVKALLLDYMGGEAEGTALADVLYGKVNPSGRLAESWCIDASDQPFNDQYANNQRRSLYKESVFVGYRYFDTFHVPVAYPFGYGLSYTYFQFDNASLDKETVDKDGQIVVRLDVANTGKMDGKAVVQIYVRSVDGKRYRPYKELKGFEKVSVRAGETKRVVVTIPISELSYYNTAVGKFVVDGGKYEVIVAYNSEEVAAVLPLTVQGEALDVDSSDKYPFYYDYSQPIEVSDQQFESVYGGKVPSAKRNRKQRHTVDSTFDEIRDRFWGRVLYNKANKLMLSMYKDNKEMMLMASKSLNSSPLRILCMLEGVTMPLVKAIVTVVNGHPVVGLFKALSAWNKEQRRLKKAKKTIQREQQL